MATSILAIVIAGAGVVILILVIVWIASRASRPAATPHDRMRQGHHPQVLDLHASRPAVSPHDRTRRSSTAHRSRSPRVNRYGELED